MVTEMDMLNLNHDALVWFANLTDELRLAEVRELLMTQVAVQREQASRNVTTVLSLMLLVFGMKMIVYYGYRLGRLMFTAVFVESVTCISILCFWLAILMPAPAYPSGLGVGVGAGPGMRPTIREF